MALLIAELIGVYLGALFITFVMTRGVNWLLRKKTDKKTSALISFVLVGLICLLIASHTMGFSSAVLYYFPCLLLWLIVDLNRATKPGRRRPYFAVIFIFSVMVIGILAALLIPNAIIAVSKAKQKSTMKDITVISTAITDYVNDNGITPAQDGTYDARSNFRAAVCPSYINPLPLTDQWGNNFLVYCGTACNGKYGIAGAKSDDFLVVSYGRDGKMDDWEFDWNDPEAGLSIITKMDDFDKDLVIWNEYWIRAPTGSKI